MRFTALLILFSINAFAQADTVFKKTENSFWGININAGQVVVHSKAVQNVKGTKPYGADVEYATIPTSFENWNHAGYFRKSGFLLSYFHFNNPILGNGLAVSYFIEPTYRVGKKIAMHYRAGIGLAYLTQPNDAIKNPTNFNYSWHINPYLNLAAGLSYKLDNHCLFFTRATFNHISNGAFKEPNKGINWITGSIGLLYGKASFNNLPRFKRDRNIGRSNRKLAMDVGVFITPSQGVIAKLQAQRKWVVGAEVQFIKPISNTNALAFGAEVFYQKFQKISNSSPINLTNPLLVGLHGGHSFLLGKFLFSQQVGYYLLNKTNYTPHFYERFTLVYHFAPHYLAGLSLKANTDNANFVDFKFQVRL